MYRREASGPPPATTRGGRRGPGVGRVRGRVPRAAECRGPRDPDDGSTSGRAGGRSPPGPPQAAPPRRAGRWYLGVAALDERVTVVSDRVRYCLHLRHEPDELRRPRESGPLAAVDLLLRPPRFRLDDEFDENRFLALVKVLDARRDLFCVGVDDG